MSFSVVVHGEGNDSLWYFGTEQIQVLHLNLNLAFAPLKSWCCFHQCSFSSVFRASLESSGLCFACNSVLPVNVQRCF